MLWGSRNAARIKNDFRKTFETPSGRNVLMYLYEHCHGKQSTMPKDGTAIQLAFNEGKRMTYLTIMEMLREEDMEVRKMYENYLSENRMEAMNE